MSTVAMYKIIDYAWPNPEISGDYNTFKECFQTNHDNHMNTFEELVNVSIAEGWVPLGAPILSSKDVMRNHYIYQAMTHNGTQVEKKMSAVEPARQSRRIQVKSLDLSRKNTNIKTMQLNQAKMVSKLRSKYDRFFTSSISITFLYWSGFLMIRSNKSKSSCKFPVNKIASGKYVSTFFAPK